MIVPRAKLNFVDLGSGEFLVALLEPDERAIVHDGVDASALLDTQEDDRPDRAVPQGASDLLRFPGQKVRLGDSGPHQPAKLVPIGGILLDAVDAIPALGLVWVFQTQCDRAAVAVGKCHHRFQHLREIALEPLAVEGVGFLFEQGLVNQGVVERRRGLYGGCGAHGAILRGMIRFLVVCPHGKALISRTTPPRNLS